MGVRWSTGQPAHRSVSETLVPLVSEQERLHPDARAWTLTWLEGRPRCTLDDLLTVTVTPDGTPQLLEHQEVEWPGEPAIEPDDDDWLGGPR